MRELIHNLGWMLYDTSNEMIIIYNKPPINHTSENDPQFWKDFIPTILVECCMIFLMKWSSLITNPPWSTNLENDPQFWENIIPSKKRSLWPQKKWKWEPQKQMLFRNNQGMYILQKTRSNLVYYGLRSLISDLQTPIGGHHPVLYFTTQITEKYSTAMC